jgi:hypothetical protein
MAPVHEQTRRPSWLHNMSVPSRSVLTCARARLPGRRYLVDWLPSGVTAGSEADWSEAMHRRLARAGMPALAALSDLYRAGRQPTPALIVAIARAGGGDAAGRAEAAFGEVLSRLGLPGGMGVFLPAPAALTQEAGANGMTRLDPLTSLAILARRSGPLYVPARSIEPSLIVLERCVLVFPVADGCSPRPPLP